MSGCHRHPNELRVPQDGICYGCWEEGDFVLDALKKITFHGLVDAETRRAAVELLRRSRFWACADLLEASVEMWNTLQKMKGKT